MITIAIVLWCVRGLTLAPAEPVGPTSRAREVVGIVPSSKGS
ncbi:hypothetical protein [Streptomyces monashensis]|nr:hypothetical protein [Streptomyces monashensis]